MKLAVIGGAGVRAPLLVGSLAKRATDLGIDEVSIFDVDRRKISLLVPLAQKLLEQAGSPYRLTVADSPADAVREAAAVITTIRPGFEEARAADERICLENGVIGQETTGAAGFAFACRSITALMQYAELTFAANPDAWLINFTNPAGLVTEALRGAGFDRVIGICDSADTGKKYAAEFLGIDVNSISSRVAGLNHLSYTTELLVNDVDRLPELLENNKFLAKAQDVFPDEMVRKTGCYLNEYLYYFLRSDHAWRSMRDEPKSRGELIVGWNSKLLERLEALGNTANEKGLETYFDYIQHRNETYMDYATGGSHYLPTDDEEGYAGVALDFLQAIDSSEETEHVFCVPNNKALDFLPDESVVEISCTIGKGRVQPIANSKLPDHAISLIKSVKNYEDLSVRAISEKRMDLAISALTAHPLVKEERTASNLMLAFRKSQPDVFKDWK